MVGLDELKNLAIKLQDALELYEKTSSGGPEPAGTNDALEDTSPPPPPSSPRRRRRRSSSGNLGVKPTMSSVKVLEENLRQAVAEKNHWMKQYLDLQRKVDNQHSSSISSKSNRRGSAVDSPSTLDDDEIVGRTLNESVVQCLTNSSPQRTISKKIPVDLSSFELSPLQESSESSAGLPPVLPVVRTVDSFSEDENTPAPRLRRRSNSELQVMADTISQTLDQRIDTNSLSPVRPARKSTSPASKEKRSLFRLLQCSDEQCEVFKPRNGSIRTSHHARSNVQLIWDDKPKRVLMIKKPNDPYVTHCMKNVAKWLAMENHMQVFIEPVVQDELKLKYVQTWKCGTEWEALQSMIDFIICLGGDGTMLWVSGLFSRSVPPIVSFALGSLGFLTPFSIEGHREILSGVLNGGFNLSLRSRLSCTYVDSTGSVKPMAPHKSKKLMMYSDEEMLRESSAPQVYHALNELVIDRGPSAAVVELDCYCDDIFVTKVCADGIIIASPTGSTAYSLSAGGSMVHPSVPAMLLTPVCPHSLSFRPLMFHDSATLKVTVPKTARTTAFVSLDGQNQMELGLGDSLLIKVSSHPIPLICKENEIEDWFQSVKGNLNWNQRRAQKPFETEEEASDEVQDD